MCHYRQRAWEKREWTLKHLVASYLGPVPSCSLCSVSHPCRQKKLDKRPDGAPQWLASTSLSVRSFFSPELFAAGLAITVMTSTSRSVWIFVMEWLSLTGSSPFAWKILMKTSHHLCDAPQSDVMIIVLYLITLSGVAVVWGLKFQ